MEHDSERTIREKVALAEQIPVAWNRDWVRSRIGLMPSRRTFAFYYAAASLILASAIFFYGVQQTRQAQLEVQLKSIELSIEQNRALASINSNSASGIQTDCIDSSPITYTEQSPRVKEVQKSKGPAEQTAALPPVEIKQEAVAIIASTPTATEIPTDTLVTASTPHQDRPAAVHAIIGGDPNIIASNNIEKKFRIRLFPQVQELTPMDGAAETTNLLSKNQ